MVLLSMLFPTFITLVSVLVVGSTLRYRSGGSSPHGVPYMVYLIHVVLHSLTAWAVRGAVPLGTVPASS